MGKNTAEEKLEVAMRVLRQYADRGSWTEGLCGDDIIWMGAGRNGWQDAAQTLEDLDYEDAAPAAFLAEGTQPNIELCTADLIPVGNAESYVRGRKTAAEIAQLMEELMLDPSDAESWGILERLVIW